MDILVVAGTNRLSSHIISHWTMYAQYNPLVWHFCQDTASFFFGGGGGGVDGNNIVHSSISLMHFSSYRCQKVLGIFVKTIITKSSFCLKYTTKIIGRRFGALQT